MASKGKDFISKQHPASLNRMLLMPSAQLQESKQLFQAAGIRKAILEVGKVHGISS